MKQIISDFKITMNVFHVVVSISDDCKMRKIHWKGMGICGTYGKMFDIDILDSLFNNNMSWRPRCHKIKFSLQL